MMDSDTIFDYALMVDEAMRDVVAQALAHVQLEGLSGDHHFFISFDTRYPGAMISPQLREAYPDEMTIVVQHQFWDLEVHSEYFTIMLSFNNVPEKLIVPFDAMTAFADPSVKFGLQFHKKPVDESVDDLLSADPSVTSFEDALKTRPESDDDSEKVISLDAFRNS